MLQYNYTGSILLLVIVANLLLCLIHTVNFITDLQVGCFYLLASVTHAAMNLGVQISFKSLLSILLGADPGAELLDPTVILLNILTPNCFLPWLPISHSRQYLRPHRHLLFSNFFFITATLAGVKCHLAVALVCVSPMTNGRSPVCVLWRAAYSIPLLTFELGCLLFSRVVRVLSSHCGRASLCEFY